MFFKNFARKNFHKGHNTLHLLYLGAAAAEGHGIYSLAAAGLFGVVVLGIFLGEDGV